MNLRDEAPTRRPLSRELILDTAIAIAGAEGVGAVSMRRVGAELGVQAMSLYNHVESKQDLIDGMAGRLLAGMEIPTAGTIGWKDAIRTVCRSYRALAHAHPSLFPTIVARPLGSPESLPPLEAVLSIMIGDGFDADIALAGFAVMASYVAGFALGEIGSGTESGRGTIARDHMPSLSLVDDRYPVTAGVLREADPDNDRAFELGLDILLDGFDRLPRQR